MSLSWRSAVQKYFILKSILKILFYFVFSKYFLGVFCTSLHLHRRILSHPWRSKSAEMSDANLWSCDGSGNCCCCCCQAGRRLWWRNSARSCDTWCAVILFIPSSSLLYTVIVKCDYVKVWHYFVSYSGQVKCVTSEALRYGSHSCYTANTPHLPLPRKHSPAPLIWLQLTVLIYWPREDERLSWQLSDLQRTVYPYKFLLLPVSCWSCAGQGKFAGQRPTFYHWATPLARPGTMVTMKKQLKRWGNVAVHIWTNRKKE